MIGAKVMKGIQKLFQKKESISQNIDMENIPVHIAIIMDGNGRWAKKRQMPRVMGHRAGVEAVRDVIRTASDLGVKYLTLYAFSTENWNRPAEEVNTLMDLLSEYMKKEIDELHRNQVKINTIGDLSRLTEKARQDVEAAKTRTLNNTGLCVNFALNYGSRDEMVRGINALAEKIRRGELNPGEITEAEIADHLDTRGIPDPDLLIRTSGEQRLSNFLLWQLAYTEFWFPEVHWPDFTGEHLIEGIKVFQNRNRRFGGL